MKLTETMKFKEKYTWNTSPILHDRNSTKVKAIEFTELWDD